MKTNFIMLRDLLIELEGLDLTRGFLHKDEEQLIYVGLHLEEMDVLALRNLRDFTVLFISQQQNRDDWSEYDKLDDIRSKITYCIDSVIFNKGGEL